MGSSNRLEKFRAQHAIRRGSDPGSTAPVGYTDPGGSTRSFTGNDKAAYVWEPPFQDPLQPIYVNRQAKDLGDGTSPHKWPRPADPVLLETDYNWGTCFESIDVADYRIITLVFEAQSPSPDIFYELMPLVSWDTSPSTTPSADQLSDIGYTPIGFVNPDVTTDQIRVDTDQPCFPLIAPVRDKTGSFSCRTVEPMCLRTKPNTNAAADPIGWTQLAIDFEVSSHTAFTLSVVPRLVQGGEVPENSTVSLYYTRRT